MSEFESRMDFIDYERKKRIRVKLENQDGEEIQFDEVVSSINQYISDRLKKENAPNETIGQIFPMCAQLMNLGLPKAVGRQTAIFAMSNHDMRYAIMSQMMMSYYFVKLIKKNNITVTSVEEDISEEEIQRLIRVDKANSLAVMGSMMGLSPKEMIKEMINQGQIQRDDFKDLADELGIEDSNDKPKGN